MIVHILADGSTLETVEGYVVPRTAARLAYDILERLGGGRTNEEENKESVA